MFSSPLALATRLACGRSGTNAPSKDRGSTLTSSPFVLSVPSPKLDGAKVDILTPGIVLPYHPLAFTRPQKIKLEYSRSPHWKNETRHEFVSGPRRDQRKAYVVTSSVLSVHFARICPFCKFAFRIIPTVGIALEFAMDPKRGTLIPTTKRS